MKIEYKILWFEDQFDEINATVEAVEGLLEDHGFQAVIQREEVVTPARVEELSEQLSGYNPYDLILFDYDLGQAGRSDGMTIAKSLRKHLYSDMVFYSGSPRSELRNLLYTQKVEGVFTAGRSSFPDDVEPIIEDQIKRISDVNMMRGIVMDEVSRFDRQLRELCLKYLNASGDLDSAKKSLGRRLVKNGNRLVKRAEEIDCPIEEYSNIKKTTFDLVKRGLSELLDRTGEVDLSASLKENGLLHKLQKLRNRLAHVEGHLDKKGIMRLMDDTQEAFDFEKFILIRKELREAGQLIQQALD